MPGGCSRKARWPTSWSSAACCTASSARRWCCAPNKSHNVSVASSPGALPTGMALPGLVIAFGMIGDTLLYAVLPLYHEQFGLRLVMVGVLLSLNRWIRLFANSGVAAIGERVGPHTLMVADAIGSAVSKTLYGLGESPAPQ